MGEEQSPVTILSSIEKKLGFFSRNIIISIAILCTISLLIRIYYFPYNVPLVLDALNVYFVYASNMVVLGHLPTNLPVSNNGWPIFLSFFFVTFHLNNVLDYMNLQRLLSILISVLTIIPVYFFCARFFKRQFALFGTAIFAFDPRLAQNSLLGITEPLYIFLVSSTLALFFSSNKKYVYASFALASLATIVRSDGLFLFLPLIIMFFVRHRKERKIIIRSAIAVSIFILILIPIGVQRMQTQGNDELTGRIVQETGHIFKMSNHERFDTYAANTVENFVKFSGWSLIPTFIFFIPVGIFLIFRKPVVESKTIIVILGSMLIPVVYEFSFIPDTRYIYPLFPLFCILSVLAVKKYCTNIIHVKIFLILTIGGILLSSGIFLDLKKYDYEHDREAFKIAQYVVSVAKGINNYYPEDSYISPAILPQNWPVLSTSLPSQPSVIPTKGFDSLKNYIESSRGKNLTDLVVDDNPKRPNFLRDVFYHEEKYPYLIKIFDSSEQGYKYHVKIFKIDYNKFGSR